MRKYIIILIILLTSCSKTLEEPAPSLDIMPINDTYLVGEAMIIDVRESTFCDKYPFQFLLVTKRNTPKDTLLTTSMIAYWVFNEEGVYHFGFQAIECSNRGWNTGLYKKKVTVYKR